MADQHAPFPPAAPVGPTESIGGTYLIMTGDPCGCPVYQQPHPPVAAADISPASSDDISPPPAPVGSTEPIGGSACFQRLTPSAPCSSGNRCQIEEPRMSAAAFAPTSSHIHHCEQQMSHLQGGKACMAACRVAYRFRTQQWTRPALGVRDSSAARSGRLRTCVSRCLPPARPPAATSTTASSRDLACRAGTHVQLTLALSADFAPTRRYVHHCEQRTSRLQGGKACVAACRTDCRLRAHQ